ncbi:MAG TPA: hypothetical protein VN634_20880 [Candidatus Limnocylindrales bacterium]|nr:hypothetical protein [Candidatus Limnocylindrales bacterium]
MTTQVASGHEEITTLADALPSVVALLGGVPVLTVLVMTAARYVASGTF